MSKKRWVKTEAREGQRKGGVFQVISWYYTAQIAQYQTAAPTQQSPTFLVVKSTLIVHPHAFQSRGMKESATYSHPMPALSET